MTTKACCDAGLPAKSTGEPIGKVFDLASSPAGKPLPCYEVGSGDRAVIVAYDIFGFTENKRTRLVCDQIAAAGMRVIMPDFYRGTDVLAHFGTFPPEGGIPAVIDWVTGVAPFDTVIEELFEVVVKYLEVRSLPPACFAPLPSLDPGLCASADPPPLVSPFLSNPSPPA